MQPPFSVALFAVRAARPCLVAGSVLLVALGSTGCSHRRSSLRPVYSSPVIAAPAATTTVVPVEPGCTPGSVANPTMTTAPAGSDPFLGLSAGSVPSGSSSTLGSGVTRAGGSGAVASPPAPDVEEPPLNEQSLTPINPAPSSGAATNPTGAIRPVQPRAYRGVARPSSSTSRPPRAAFINAVRPYTDNVEDLVHPPKADRPWRYVVLHQSGRDAGGLDAIDREHRRVLGYEGCGYHFIIGNGTDSPDGRIELADRWLNQKNGVHCRNGRPADVNEYGISICLVGDFDHAEPTPRQIAAARALVAYLGDRYSIDPSQRGTHDQFADGPTRCPGTHFPTDAILGNNPHVAQN